MEDMRNTCTVWKYMDLTYLAQGRDQWGAVLNTVMNLQFP